MEKCNYKTVGTPIYKGSYDVRQEYKTDCGIKHVNLHERVWNGTEAISIKPNGTCIYCKKDISVTINPLPST